MPTAVVTHKWVPWAERAEEGSYGLIHGNQIVGWYQYQSHFSLKTEEGHQPFVSRADRQIGNHAQSHFQKENPFPVNESNTAHSVPVSFENAALFPPRRGLFLSPKEKIMGGNHLRQTDS